MAAIGIDLGTTNSCVAVLQNDQVEVLQNDHTNRVTPSCVAYNDHEQLIGDDAKEQRGENPENTIFSVKRLIGRQFSDETVQNDLKHFPFKVIRDYLGRPKIRVKTNKGEKEMFPEEISGIVLSEMKKIAEERIGGKVYNAVITVPAYFNDAQRRATKAAAELAGLHVLEIIGEPDAAAIAYTQQQKIPKERNVLVYDLGGGTFDVTVLTIRGADVTVLATGGDTHLGGDDFSYRMLGHFVEEFEKKWGINVMGNVHAKARLIQKCEKLKLKLSTKKMEKIKISALADGKDFESQVTRAKFEDWNEDIFSGTLDAVKEVLVDSKISRAEIDEVLLVGGSTRIPYIRNMLEKYFGAAKILQKVNPDEAVAYGAAVYAAHLSGVKIPGIGEVRVRSVYPMSLGTDIVGDLMSVLIKRNTPIPTKQVETYSTTRDNQSAMSVQVYAGERAKLEDNIKLDGFDISPLPKKPKGVIGVEVTFELNRSGILDVTACEKSTGVMKSIVVKPDQKNWSANEIAEMRRQAEEFRRRDNEYREQVSARNALEKLVYNVKRRNRSFATFHKSVTITNWMENNKNASRDAYVAKRKELEVFEACND